MPCGFCSLSPCGPERTFPKGRNEPVKKGAAVPAAKLPIGNVAQLHTTSRCYLMFCGWNGSVEELTKISGEEIMRSLISFYRESSGENPAATQTDAWEDSIQVLREQFAVLIRDMPTARNWGLAFEYELPREGGRRPDAVVLAGNRIAVLEFKEKQSWEQADIDQVEAYARDIRNYHEASRGHLVIPVLVPTRRKGETERLEDVVVVPPSQLARFFLSLPTSHESQLDLSDWLMSDYAPLPSLVEAARRIFNSEPLPQIKRAHSAKVDETIRYLLDVADKAEKQKEWHLALITGVPGAGKTLVGLRFVHEHHQELSEGRAKTSVFLSGNGPLVTVLQDALKSTIFVQPMHNFIKQYWMRGTAPKEQVLVFDEAQRAWDAEQVREHHKGVAASGEWRSEPEMLVNIVERHHEWALIVGLVGEGQEIYVGEEAGLGQWNTAIARSRLPWVVHGPARLAGLFTAASEYHSEDLLNLTTSLRTHLAEDVQEWIHKLLEGKIAECKPLADTIFAQGFRMYLTQSLDQAERYVQTRYSGEPQKRFGLLASSRAKNLERYGVRNGFEDTRKLRQAKWYNEPSDSPESCCALEAVATEFDAQGLELDFPIVCWGDDLKWSNSKWVSKPYRGKKNIRDPHMLRLNSYRVLLSRGRDGFVVFVPPEPEMRETVSLFIDAGVRWISEPNLITPVDGSHLDCAERTR